MKRAVRTIAALVIWLVVAACLPQAGPEINVPPGVVSSQTAQGVGQKMLAEIAANEQTLGRALASARIIRIQLLRAGEMIELPKLDGSNPDGLGMAPNDGPGWIVEAVGTFIEVDDQTGLVLSRGMHGFRRWDDAGGEGMAFYPCWGAPPSEMDGSCP